MSKMNFNEVTLKKSVFYKDDNPIFGETVTHIELDDEAGGAFIILSQVDEDAKLKFDLEELELIYHMAKQMINDYDRVRDEC